MTEDNHDSFDTVEKDPYQNRGEWSLAGKHPIQDKLDNEDEHAITDGGVVEGIKDELPDEWEVSYDGRELRVAAGGVEFTVYDGEWAGNDLNQLYKDLCSADYAIEALEGSLDVREVDWDERNSRDPRTIWNPSLGSETQY